MATDHIEQQATDPWREAFGVRCIPALLDIQASRGAQSAGMRRTPNASRDQACSRAAFLSRVSAGILATAAGAAFAGSTETPSAVAASARWKGSKSSKVKRWDVITIGNLSRNHYWGEGDAKGVRSAICTCTVIQGEGFRLIVDPSLSSADEMARELDRRTGLKPGEITAAFVTHEHGDHWYGLAHFPEARWLAAPDVAIALDKTGKLLKPVAPVTERLFDAIDIVPTAGHTLSHHSLRFDCEGLSVVTAGDAVATQDFWRERRGYYNCVDFALAARSMDKIAGLADIVVPGHDNYFLNVNPIA
jgi:glyoxylase-like metal-dependent hydrolase (beta-lactamase superfamily II)